MSYRLIKGDCVEEMGAMTLNSFDALVTDPPYELGFMGQRWDGSGVAFQRETWEAAINVLKPGAYLLAFGGARTYHRLAAAIEDGGFEVRDSIMWLYATGFPKSKDLGDGFGTALKPAHEPIVVARKPPEGTTTENFARWGTGGLNIRGSLIPFISEADLLEALAKNPGKDGATVTSDVYGADRPQQSVNESGRWPANLALDEAAGTLLDKLSGIRPGGGYPERRGENSVFNPTAGGNDGPRSMGDTGGASRFFFSGKVGRLERDLGLEDFEAKMLRWSSGEQSPGTFQSGGTNRFARNSHPTVKPIELMRWLLGLVTPPEGRVLDPFCGSGSTGCAAVLDGINFTGIEKEPEFFRIACERIKTWERYEGRAVEDVLRSAAANRTVKEAGQVGLFD